MARNHLEAGTFFVCDSDEEALVLHRGRPRVVPVCISIEECVLTCMQALFSQYTYTSLKISISDSITSMKCIQRC